MRGHVSGRFGSRSPVVLHLFLAGLLLAGAARAFAQDTDPTFNATTDGIVFAVAEQSDGRILIGGSFTLVNNVARTYLARLMPDGSLDSSFNVAVDSWVYDIRIQQDGRVLVGGLFSTVAGAAAPKLVRLLATGDRDTGFAPPATTFVVGSAVQRTAIQPDGRILVAGQQFRNSGIATGLVRLESDGTLDGGFAPNPDSGVYGLALQTDGRVLIGGAFTSVAGASQARLARLESTGAIDNTFLPNVQGGLVQAIAVRADGRVLLGGGFTSVDGQARHKVAQVDAQGGLDTTFSVASNTNPSDVVSTIVLQPDGKVLLGGNFVGFGGIQTAKLARFETDGSPDLSFVPRAYIGAGFGGGYVATVAVQADGRILAGGSYPVLTVARFPAEIPNLPPTISAIGNQNLSGAANDVLSTGPLAFTVSDPEGGTVTVSAVSSNTTLVPPGGLVLGGSGTARTITVTTATTLAGQASITLTASDGVRQATTSFLVTVTRVAPDVPRNLTATLSRDVVQLTWQPPAQAAVVGYLIEAGYSPGDTALTLPLGNTLSFQAVAPPATYFVRVRTRMASGHSGPSNEVTFSTNLAPGTPLDFRAEVVGNAVSLYWTENPAGMAPTAYEIRAGSAPGLSDVAVLQVGPLSRALHVTAPTGDYFVRLRAVNAVGASADSNELHVSPAPGACSPRPSAPTGLTVSTGPGQVSLSWSPSPGAAGYELVAGSAPGGTDVGRFPLPATPGLSASAPAGQYFIRLFARSSAGCLSDASGEVSFVVP